MFLKRPRNSTDQRVRSLLQKAARRGYTKIVKLAVDRLDSAGDKNWLRSRAIVITFEESWPLAASLSVTPGTSSKLAALLSVTNSVKQKDAAGLGALAYAYREGEHSILNCVPNRQTLRIVSEALQRPKEFFAWVSGQSKSQQSTYVVQSAQRYLSAATWQWDKACILAGALLATSGDMPVIEAAAEPSAEFPYWVALDKHTPEGKLALRDVAKQIKSTYRQLIWANFYCESALANRILVSPWWEAEKRWRLGRAGLSLDAAEELWSRARPLISQRLEIEAATLKHCIEAPPSQYVMPN